MGNIIYAIRETLGISQEDRDLALQLKDREIPVLTVFNKADLLTQGGISDEQSDSVQRGDDLAQPDRDMNQIYVSALTGHGIHELKERIAKKAV